MTLLTVSLNFFNDEFSEELIWLSEELNCSPAFVTDPLSWLPALLKLPVANVVGANLLPVARRLVLAGVLETVLLWPLVAAAPPMGSLLIAMPGFVFVTI